MKQFIAPSLFLLLLCLFACQPLEEPQSFKESIPTLPEVPDIYSDIQFPEHFVELPMEFDQNGRPLPQGTLSHRVTDPGARLGRVLFYDKQLSLNNRISCGSCHKQAYGFADPNASSEGFKGAITPRNSMAIVNPILNNHFFWDSRVRTAEQLALEPVKNHIEMGMESMPQLIRKLEASSYYPQLFLDAYGSVQIKEGKISDALAQFLNAVVSYNSKFDQGHRNDFADFTPLESMGMTLFFNQKAKCASCHNGGNFDAPDGHEEPYGGRSINGNPKGTANIGLDTHYADPGFKDGQFKIPSLRNIALTAPYMHDGRYQTLEEVVRHYSSQIQLHPNLDEKFQSRNGELQRLNLTELEIQALVAFLHTLTDEQMVTDPKFSDPFLH